MKHLFKNTGYLLLGLGLMIAGCKKDKVTISQPEATVANPISDASPLSGSVKGTMLTGKTYVVSGDLVVNKGDTLWLQKGTRVNVTAKASITIRGAIISLGTKDAPNWITVPGITKTDNPDQDPSTDPAFSGKWYGINCDTTCKLFIMKWTHVEFAGANVTNLPVSGLTVGAPSFAIFFQNINGVFVFEDSWIYGTADDAIRVNSGKISIMRNTFEKQGFNSGESVNVKSGCVGDIAYNLFIGGAVNAVKASNSGATAIQANINTYNNTIIDNGFRNGNWAGHGACINYEKQVKGKVYNNMLINCRTGFRVVNTADTSNLSYGNTFHYGDSLNFVSKYYPVGDVTHPQNSDVPVPANGYLPAGYVLGASFTASVSFVGSANPMFKNFTLPNYNFKNYTYVSGFDFRLQSASPAAGKGYTGFNALAPIAVNSNFGPSEITQPGGDIGCYQLSGSGNQH